MKLLAAAEQKARMRHLDKFYDVLRKLEIFEPLTEDSLRDLSAQLQLKEYDAHKIILKKAIRAPVCTSFSKAGWRLSATKGRPSPK
jgi:hypothetical protein